MMTPEDADSDDIMQYITAVLAVVAVIGPHAAKYVYGKYWTIMSLNPVGRGPYTPNEVRFIEGTLATENLDDLLAVETAGKMLERLMRLTDEDVINRYAVPVTKTEMTGPATMIEFIEEHFTIHGQHIWEYMEGPTCLEIIPKPTFKSEGMNQWGFEDFGPTKQGGIVLVEPHGMHQSMFDVVKQAMKQHWLVAVINKTKDGEVYAIVLGHNRPSYVKVTEEGTTSLDDDIPFDVQVLPDDNTNVCDWNGDLTVLAAYRTIFE